MGCAADDASGEPNGVGVGGGDGQSPEGWSSQEKLRVVLESAALSEAARKRKPQRWSRKTRNWSLSDVVWLNPEREVDRGQKRKAA